MAEAITIARPYAHAVFAIAHAKNQLKVWSQLLAIFAQCTADPSIQSIIANPKVDNEKVIALVADIAGDLMNGDAYNTLALLAANNRLRLLGDIATIYEALLAESEQVITADVITAKTLTTHQIKNISTALKKRLGKEIILNENIDESLLGGAIIQAGDLVIDGSALGKLNRLANATSY